MHKGERRTVCWHMWPSKDKDAISMDQTPTGNKRNTMTRGSHKARNNHSTETRSRQPWTTTQHEGTPFTKPAPTPHRTCRRSGGIHAVCAFALVATARRRHVPDLDTVVPAPAHQGRSLLWFKGREVGSGLVSVRSHRFTTHHIKAQLTPDLMHTRVFSWEADGKGGWKKLDEAFRERAGATPTWG